MLMVIMSDDKSSHFRQVANIKFPGRITMLGQTMELLKKLQYFTSCKKCNVICPLCQLFPVALCTGATEELLRTLDKISSQQNLNINHYEPAVQMLCLSISCCLNLLKSKCCHSIIINGTIARSIWFRLKKCNLKVFFFAGNKAQSYFCFSPVIETTARCIKSTVGFLETCFSCSSMS